MGKIMSAPERDALRRRLRREQELAEQEPGFVAKEPIVEPCNGCEDKKKGKAKRVSKQNDEQSKQSQH